MADKNLILTLAKVIVAVAWVDGEISTEEMSSLKDLIFRLANIGVEHGNPINGEEWARLEMYIEAPVGVAERTRLVEQLQASLQSEADRALAIVALENLVQADGVVTDAETDATTDIKQALESVKLGGLTRLRQLVGHAVHHRTAAVAQAPNREDFFEDYVKNKVYYAVRQHLQETGQQVSLSEADLRKLSLAGGLMARVAHTDQQVTPAEMQIMINALQANWGIDALSAELVAEVAAAEISRDLDYYRMTREFFNYTTEPERQQFLTVLFAVAAADGQVDAAEREGIRRIARSLQLRQSAFIHAQSQFDSD
ncbi:MAG: TerB family tellurite resistance protein [Anaerolineales bacterium]|nr:TerB family tellurite resistance protein [Anaerolineales bacterium]